MKLINFAYQVIDLHEENQRLKAEVEDLRHYKQEYMDMLSKNISHANMMQNRVLTLILNKGDVSALVED